MSRPIKIPLHGLLLQISFYTPVYNYTTVFFFFFFSLSFLPRDFLSVDKKKERRHYRSVTAFIGENRPGYSPRIKARRNEFAKYDPAERTWCFSRSARARAYRAANKTVSYGKEILLPCIIDNYCRGSLTEWPLKRN